MFEKRLPMLVLFTILLKKHEKSHWHRLTKNETLHFYKGDPLTIYTSKDGDKFSTGEFS